MTLDEAKATLELAARLFPDLIEAVAVAAEAFAGEVSLPSEYEFGKFELPSDALHRFADSLRVKKMTPAERTEWWRQAAKRPNSAIRGSGD